MSTLNIVILAAGKGTRMYSDKPKVLHMIAGKGMLQHVIDTASSLHPAKTIVVYGHGGELVPQSLSYSTATFVLQEPQLGTGHAVKQAPNWIMMSLFNHVRDVPLIHSKHCKRY